MLTLKSGGKTVTYDIVSHPFGAAAVSNSFRDLNDKPVISRFAATGNLSDMDATQRAALSSVIASGTVSLSATSDSFNLRHNAGSMDAIVVATCVGDAVAWVDSRTANVAKVKVRRGAGAVESPILVNYVVYACRP